MTLQTKRNLECCPKFDPALWDDKIFQWEGKKFVKDKVCSFFYMPLNFGSVMKRLSKKLDQENCELSDCLSDHTSKWNIDIYLAVDKDFPDMENTVLSGQFYSKVYEGPYKDTGKWSKDFDKLVEEKGLKSKKKYYCYTTCPKCAKKYGKNYVAIVSQIE